MERILLWFIFSFLTVYGNPEVDALSALKRNLTDPNNIMQSWNVTKPNPCLWFHVTCNIGNSVTRLDLGNGGLSGPLVPELVQLINLEYLELYNNNITGNILTELGLLKNLVGLDLYLNRLEGSIPDTLGKLQKLGFLRLSNNYLTGTIPYSLTTISGLQVLDLSNNLLTGVVPLNGSFSLFTYVSFKNNSNLTYLRLRDPPGRTSATRAIVGGVAAGGALLFAGLIALVWWLRRKPRNYFFDIPAEEDSTVCLAQLKRFSLRELQVAT